MKLLEIKNQLETFSIHKNEDKTFFLEYKESFFLISEFYYRLIKNIKFNSGLTEKSLMNELDIDEQDLYYIYNDLFSQIEKIKSRKFNKTLYIQYPIFKSNFVNIITRYSKHLIPKKISAFVCLITLLLSVFVFLLLNTNQEPLTLESTGYNVFYIYLSLIFTSIIHEFGHASACKLFNKDPGDIGIGIFFLFPVFYSDVTKIWTLNTKKRIIVNLSGLYFQIIFCITFYFIFMDETTFIKSYLLTNITLISFSFIPFIKTDGYWVLSDFFGKKNLYENSNKYLIELVLGKKEFDTFYFIYSFSNLIFILYLLYIFFYSIKNQILYLIDNPISYIFLLKLIFHLFILYFLVKSLIKKIRPSYD